MSSDLYNVWTYIAFHFIKNILDKLLRYLSQTLQPRHPHPPAIIVTYILSFDVFKNSRISRSIRLSHSDADACHPRVVRDRRVISPRTRRFFRYYWRWASCVDRGTSPVACGPSRYSPEMWLYGVVIWTWLYDVVIRTKQWIWIYLYKYSIIIKIYNMDREIFRSLSGLLP